MYILFIVTFTCLLGLSVKNAPSWHTNLDLKIIASSCMVPLPCTCFGFRADPFCVLSKFIYFFLSNDHWWKRILTIKPCYWNIRITQPLTHFYEMNAITRFFFIMYLHIMYLSMLMIESIEFAKLFVRDIANSIQKPFELR